MQCSKVPPIAGLGGLTIDARRNPTIRLSRVKPTKTNATPIGAIRASCQRLREEIIWGHSCSAAIDCGFQPAACCWFSFCGSLVMARGIMRGHSNLVAEIRLAPPSGLQITRSRDRLSSQFRCLFKSWGGDDVSPVCCSTGVLFLKDQAAAFQLMPSNWTAPGSHWGVFVPCFRASFNGNTVHSSLVVPPSGGRCRDFPCKFRLKAGLRTGDFWILKRYCV